MSIPVHERLLHIFQPDIINRRRDRKYNKQLKTLDAGARDVVLKVRGYTMLNPEKLYAFIQAVRYVSGNRIQGDIVECGVWRGGAIMAAAMVLEQLGEHDRNFYLYDTFTGMTKPSEKDKPMDGTGQIDIAMEFERKKTGPDSSDWCCASIGDVRANLELLTYDQSRFRFVQGKVEETIPDVLPESISILRLDTDWYESTKHEMDHLMPLLVPKGVLIVDDYYRWTGNKDAVDEYLLQHNTPLLLTKVGNSAIGVKPC